MTAIHKPRTNLKRRLRRLGITQDAIAARAKVSRTYVVHYMAGRRKGQRIAEAIAALIEEAKQRRDCTAA